MVCADKGDRLRRHVRTVGLVAIEAILAERRAQPCKRHRLAIGQAEHGNGSVFLAELLRDPAADHAPVHRLAIVRTGTEQNHARPARAGGDFQRGAYLAFEFGRLDIGGNIARQVYTERGDLRVGRHHGQCRVCRRGRGKGDGPFRAVGDCAGNHARSRDLLCRGKRGHCCERR